MTDDFYQGFRIEGSAVPKTGAADSYRCSASGGDGTAFVVIASASYSTSGDRQMAGDILAKDYARQYVHGLIDLDRYEHGSTTRVEVPSAPPSGRIDDYVLENELLAALRRIAQLSASSRVILFLDVDGIAGVLGIDRIHVQEILGEMETMGWIEGHLESFGASLTDGRCRLTRLGLAEAKRRSKGSSGATQIRPDAADGETGMYDVSVSFAGEDRDFVEQTVRAMEGLGLVVFYDLDHQAELLGRDLTEALHDIYAKRSRRVLMFVSKAYVAKAIPTHERRSALSRAINEPSAPYVIQAKLADVEVPGIPSSQVWADGRADSPEELADLIFRHLEADSDRPASDRESRTETLRQIDRELYQDLVTLLPSSGVIRMLETEGLSPSWEPIELQSLREFQQEWNNAEHEFQDQELESLRLRSMAAVDDLFGFIAMNTFRLENRRQGIPPEWEDTQRERALEVEDQLLTKGDAVVEAHQDLVRAVRQRQQ